MSFRLEIKKQEIIVWAHALVVIFYVVSTVFLFVLGRTDYVEKLASLWFYIPALLVALAVVYAAYRRWPAPHEKVIGRT